MTNKKTGGIARAESLSPERRKEIANMAIKARWENEKLRESLPHVILKRNDLKLADITIPCAIVEGTNGGDPIRVLTETGLSNAILGGRSGGAIRRKRELKEAGAPLPIFLVQPQLNPILINLIDTEPLLKPIEYVDGNKIMTGYDARILPLACDIWQPLLVFPFLR